MRAVICDHEPLFAAGLETLIRGLDSTASVSVTHDLTELLALPDDTPIPDLILLAAAQANGHEDPNVRAMRRRFGLAQIILIASRCSRADAERFINNGAAGVILRSDTAQLIRSAVQLVLNGGVFLPPSVVSARRREQVGRGAPESEAAPLPEPAARLPLTRRQITVLSLMGRGWSNKRIARELGVSEGTVKVHVNAILRALQVSNRTQAALEAARTGLCTPAAVERDDDTLDTQRDPAESASL